MKTLIDMIRIGSYPDIKAICNLLKDILPQNAKIPASLIANVRICANQIARKMGKDELTKVGLITAVDAAAIIREAQEDSLAGRIGGYDMNNPEYATVATKELKAMIIDALDNGKELDVVVNFL